jgi:hypothetical protein
MHDPRAHRKRRTLFLALLAVVFVPALVAAAVPDGEVGQTVLVASESDVEPTTTDAPTTVTPPPTTAETTTSTVVRRTTTTTKPKPTTTTTKPKPTTTTTAPKPAARTQAAAPPPPPATVAPSGPGASGGEAAFLACVRRRESGGNYSVVSSNGLWFGAYQMTRQTWDSTARHAGRPDLVGIPPNLASPADQDHLALVLYRWQGKTPWGGAC